ncbi:histamine H2 receptor [Topomyia yanbarensis]|uniref:histamine H2 receptor n=1 Tax=Topomyia yanbarensis TaxID=2498891 RepID=UPI00273B5941|nr:histamine H2 receptor [Topomyia yanbarensis]XP_058811595.1 histamine H2 receptor [Topomyia yanbarensis]XP_058811603.1 histamine H2 receptor [Topomyia yanbarensis]XP_058811611.1 histamine H2 receptor [Topomyia yanbarensis]XP_058811618.1 histamine H2 receptor [Topomyia yanbarensis]XP_058811626.1 histamine H2 receptor [Topomyia yanbarensis]
MLDSEGRAMELEELIETTTVRVFADRVTVINGDLFIWAIIDGVLMICILSGNILTILAVRYHRRLRQLLSNLFVLSLALSDIFVGLTLPYHLAFYMGNELGHHKHFCLLRFFVLIIACGVSIWNLIAIAVDRYIAICYPLHYARVMTKKVALAILAFGWILAFFVGSLPLIWNKWETAMECEFDELLYPWYVAGVITPLFTLVWVCLLIVYWRIWREAAKHAKQLRAHNSQESFSDWKSVQVVLLIIGCFTLCWLPYFIVILTQIFNFFDYNSPILYKAVFSLAMANSMMNPIIYAWKNTSFRHAFSKLLTCRKPDQFDGPQTGDSPRGKSSKMGNSRINTEDLRCRGTNTSTSRISQASTETVTHGNEHDITYISTIHDESNQSHTVQLSLGGTNDTNCSSAVGPTSITTHIIKGNVIINNYNLYESFLDVRNENRTNCSVSNNSSFRDTTSQKKQTDEINGKYRTNNCEAGLGINNPSFQEDVTKL